MRKSGHGECTKKGLNEEVNGFQQINHIYYSKFVLDRNRVKHNARAMVQGTLIHHLFFSAPACLFPT